MSHTLRCLSKELEVNMPVSTGHQRTAVIAYSCPLFLYSVSIISRNETDGGIVANVSIMVVSPFDLSASISQILITDSAPPVKRLDN